MFTLLAMRAALAQGVSYRVDIEAPDPPRRAARRQSGPAALAGQSPPRHGPAAAPGQGHARPGLSTLIATEGYYSPRVAATLDTSGSEPVARIVVDPGQPTIVGEVDLVLKGFRAYLRRRQAVRRGRTAQPLVAASTGSRFRQADWEAAKRGLLRQVIQVRYPRAHDRVERHCRPGRAARPAQGGARQRARGALRRAQGRRPGSATRPPSSPI
ncbi:hypothetical protein LP420_15630 [Massilia sp. B-10]|nr:hypothetical protein LP420_15630 [Massilia sp. B-10]